MESTVKPAYNRTGPKKCCGLARFPFSEVDFQTNPVLVTDQIFRLGKVYGLYRFRLKQVSLQLLLGALYLVQ